LTAFHDLSLDDAITRALAEEKYLTPTPIQAQTIPVVMSGRDVIGIAQTGTGKTAAFALPILHRLAADQHPPARKSCRILVLSPTRELSGQILDSFRTYGRHLRIRAALAIGGVSMASMFWSRRPAVCLISSKATRSGLTASNVWCSTRPTGCWTWASSMTSAKSSPGCRASARP
jgi:ATP-dependent RNA helicase RhlE